MFIVYAYLYAFAHVYAFVCVYIMIHKHTYVRTYIHTYVHTYTLEVVDMSRHGGCKNTISGGMYESCGAHYMFPGCQAAPLALEGQAKADES